MTSTAQTIERADWRDCDLEPIPSPGSIQPYGVLLAFDRSSEALVQWAADLDGFVGRTHGLAPFTAIAEQRLTRTRYARLLQALFIFHSAIAVAAQRSGWSSICSSTEKLDLIVTDLSRLGVFAPDWISVWRPGCRQAVLGAICVAEASVFGGKLIARQLDYLLRDSDEGRQFFIGRGDPDSLNWRRLLATLAAGLADPRSLDRATAGAQAAADLFETCVARVMPAEPYSSVDMP